MLRVLRVFLDFEGEMRNKESRKYERRLDLGLEIGYIEGFQSS